MQIICIVLLFVVYLYHRNSIINKVKLKAMTNIKFYIETAYASRNNKFMGEVIQLVAKKNNKEIKRVAFAKEIDTCDGKQLYLDGRIGTFLYENYDIDSFNFTEISKELASKINTFAEKESILKIQL